MVIFRLDIGLEVVAAIVERVGQLELLYDQMKQNFSKVKVVEVMDTYGGTWVNLTTRPPITIAPELSS